MQGLLLAILLAATLGTETMLPDGGRIEQRGDRLDLFDARSRRAGSGSIRQDGSADLYNADSTRRGTITPGRNLLPTRISPKR